MCSYLYGSLSLCYFWESSSVLSTCLLIFVLTSFSLELMLCKIFSKYFPRFLIHSFGIFCFFMYHNFIFLMKTMLLKISLNFSSILISKSPRLFQKISYFSLILLLFLTLEFFIYFGILVGGLILSGWRQWLLPLDYLIFPYCPLYELFTPNLAFSKMLPLLPENHHLLLALPELRV